jgi:hypothetical protein
MDNRERDLFRSRLRGLFCIDRHEVERAGHGLTDAQWALMREDPARFFMQADEQIGEIIWGCLAKPHAVPATTTKETVQ